MSEKIEYLSDEELMKLIEDVEANHLVEAPFDLKEQVLSKISQIESKKETIENEPSNIVSIAEYKKRVSAYRIYCIRVVAAAAVAITLVFAVPMIKGSGERNEMPVAAQEIAPAEIGLFKTIGKTHYVSTIGSNTELFNR